MTRLPSAMVCLALASLAVSCRRETATHGSSTPAAKVTAGVPEASLTTVTLSGDAQKRLAIETSPVERRMVRRTRVLGAEVVAAGGAQLTVAAPMAGTLGETGGLPAVGARVSRGMTVLTLVPFAPAERDVRIEAERTVAEAASRQEMATKRAERARRLVQDGSGSVRASEEAQADLAVADAALKAARDRLALASRGVSASGAVALTAPRDAVLTALHARPGQTVGAGAPLFDLVALESVWVRVPVYAGDVGALDRRASIAVTPLGAGPEAQGATAAPVSAPPTADAATAGIDLFYALDNRARELRPGQRVSVRVPLRAAETSLLVPRAAVLFDAFGGTWVYEARGDGVFTRQRIALADFVDDVAVLQRGPAVGVRVVTTGAAELFGTEFGVGK